MRKSTLPDSLRERLACGQKGKNLREAAWGRLGSGTECNTPLRGEMHTWAYTAPSGEETSPWLLNCRAATRGPWRINPGALFCWVDNQQHRPPALFLPPFCLLGERLRKCLENSGVVWRRARPAYPGHWGPACTPSAVSVSTVLPTSLTGGLYFSILLCSYSPQIKTPIPLDLNTPWGYQIHNSSNSQQEARQHILP